MKKIIKVSITFIFTFIMFYTLFININLVDLKAQSYDKNTSNISSINNIEEKTTDYNVDLLYNNAINEVAALAKSLKLDNSLEVYYLFDYILSNGYLSNTDPILTEDDSNLLDLSDEELLGLDVMYGQMNCRHITDFFTKVLMKLGYDAYAMPCYITTSKYDENDLPNHVITIINDNGTLYIDATNKIIFDRYNTNLSDSSDSYYAIAMPEYSSYDRMVTVTHNSDEDINYINNLYNNDNEKISNININKEYNKTMNIIDNNSKTINVFRTNYKATILDKLPSKNEIIANTIY